MRRLHYIEEGNDGALCGAFKLAARVTVIEESVNCERCLAMMGRAETRTEEEEAQEAAEEGEEIDVTRTQSGKLVSGEERQQPGDVGAQDEEGGSSGFGRYFAQVKAGIQEEDAEEESLEVSTALAAG